MFSLPNKTENCSILDFTAAERGRCARTAHARAQTRLSLHCWSLWAHTDKTSAHCPSEVSMPHPLHSSCLAKASRHVQSTQQPPPEHLALAAKRAGVPELHSNVTIGQTDRRLLAGHPLQALLRWQKETQPQSSWEKKAYLISLELQPEGQAWSFPNI